MDLQGQRDLLLLSELNRDGGATQRTLATKLGVALGLTNLYLKRLARKGYIKITTIPRNRIQVPPDATGRHGKVTIDLSLHAVLPLVLP